MFKSLKDTINTLAEMPVSETRKKELSYLVDFIQNKLDSEEVANITFICTHNSRRSHLSQIWAQSMAHYFGLDNIFCYSGGTVATALYTKVAETLIKQGFQIQTLTETDNPVYAVKFSENTHPVIGFSKKYDDEFNPVSQFAAIMTCSNADDGCPFIAGAEKRIAIKYEDPKNSDGTPEMDDTYILTSLEIASEMYYVFSKIKK